MARRTEPLMPLTHDHHHALAQCRRLKSAGTLTDRKELVELGDAFLNFYLGRALHHFREEEELFFPPAARVPELTDLVTRAVLEHLTIHGLAGELKRQLRKAAVSPDLLLEISDTLRRHVRFEEDELFPLIEESVPSEVLEELATHRREV